MSLGSVSEPCEMANLDIQYSILRGSMNKSITMDSVTFPESALFLSNTDDFVSITVTKWKTSQYPWISTSNSINIKININRSKRFRREYKRNKFHFLSH